MCLGTGVRLRERHLDRALAVRCLLRFVSYPGAFDGAGSLACCRPCRGKVFSNSLRVFLFVVVATAATALACRS